MKTSETHPLRIDGVQTSAGGRIGLTFCPGKHQTDAMTGSWARDMRLDIDAICAWGASVVVTLMPQDELDSVQAGSLGQAIRERGITWFHLPITDVQTSTQVWEEAWALVSPLLWKLLNAGGQVLVHCKGGLGRAGTVAAMLLVEDGEEPGRAIARVRAARPGSLETSAQERYVEAHANPRVPAADPTHIEAFLSAAHEPQGTFGRVPARWAAHVFARCADPVRVLRLDGEWIGRDRLHALRDDGASPEVLFLSTMAWGGMKVAHGAAAWSMRPFWSEVIRKAMAGGSTRKELFAAFNSQAVPGMRAAYFTKLIHFCQKRDGQPIGYIMDQWTAKSVNLLWGAAAVRLEASNWVHPDNNEAVYESFCQKIDALALILDVSGSEAEERLFSRGGRVPAAWRRYVRGHR